MSYIKVQALANKFIKYAQEQKPATYDPSRLSNYLATKAKNELPAMLKQKGISATAEIVEQNQMYRTLVKTNKGNFDLRFKTGNYADAGPFSSGVIIDKIFSGNVVPEIDEVISNWKSELNNDPKLANIKFN